MPCAKRFVVPVALSVVAPVLAATTPPPRALAAEPSHAPVAGSFTLVGRGYGHGRGMSQWGSKQQATEGRTWQQILAFYYPGATVASTTNRNIRVSTAGRTGGTARVAAESGLTASDGSGQVLSLPTSDAGTPIKSWEVSRPSSGGTASTTTLWFRTATARKALRSTESGRWTLSAADGSLVAQNSAGSAVATYLGRFTGNRSGTSVVPVLTTTLENYTRQVVPWENYTSWPVQAQAAQAVAARSYGAWYAAHPRSSLYDICDTTSCQVFGGISQESSQTREGVASSAGRVLTVSGAVARTEFSASNGGQVAPGASYSPSKRDPYEYRLPTTVTTWTGTVTAARLQASWPQVGTVTRLAVTGRDGQGQWGGRVTQLRLTGTSGSVSITPSQLGTRVTGWKGAWFTLVDGPDALSHDWTGDGRPELFARDAAGNLASQEFTGSATAAAPRRVGTGWNGFTAVATGRYTSDRIADAVALSSDGSARLYPSVGNAWGTPRVVRTGLTGVKGLTISPTLASGRPVVLTRRSSDGALLGLAVGSDDRLASPTVRTPVGWPATVTSLFAVRNVVGDAHDDLVVRTTSGDLLAFPATSSGSFGAPTRIGTGWSGFASVSSPGDVNADGRSDLVGRRSDGSTLLYRSVRGGGFSSPVALGNQVATLLA